MAEQEIFDQLTGIVEEFVKLHGCQIDALSNEVCKDVLRPLLAYTSEKPSQSKAISLIDECISVAQTDFSIIAKRLSLDLWVSVLRRFPRQAGFSDAWQQYTTLGLIRYSASDRDSTLGRADTDGVYGLAMLYTDEDMFDAFRIARLGVLITDLSGIRRWVGKGARLRPNTVNLLNLDIPGEVRISVAEYERRRPSSLFLQDEGLLAHREENLMGFPVIVLSEPKFSYLYVPDRDISLLCRYFPGLIDGSVLQRKLATYEEAIQDIFNVSVDAIVHFFAALTVRVLDALPKFGNVKGDVLQLVSNGDNDNYSGRLDFLFRICHLGVLRFPQDVIVRRLADVRSPWAQDNAEATELVRDFLDAFIVTPGSNRNYIDLTLLRPFPYVYSSTSGDVYIDLLATMDFFSWIIERAKGWFSTQHGDHFTLALKKWIEDKTGGVVLKWKEVIRDENNKNCEVDLLVLHSEKLFVIECKAYAKSRNFFRGDPDAVRLRSTKIKQAVGQAMVAAKAVRDAVLRGEISCVDKEDIDWIVCTPTQEYLRPPDKYGYVASKVPRVCTPEELTMVFPKHG